MTVILTHELRREAPLDAATNHQTYCGLDNCVTLEVFQELRRTYNQFPEIYEFSKQLQGPYLDIMLRGFLVDELSRQAAVRELNARCEALQSNLNAMASAVWDRGLNPRSTKDLKEFFYGRMQLPEVWLSQKGQKKLSVNREALEKLDQYLYARPFVSTILRLRELKKQLEVFTTEIDSDGRHRASYNIAGTETGRTSSSENAFGTGGPQQNIAPGLRWVFVASPGHKLCVIDLEQVEARDVGYFIGCLFNDWTFLDACESGDLHTANARRIWPSLAWTGNLQQDRQIANGVFYREFTYRDMAKRGSHLSNYMGTAWTASRHLKVPLKLMEDFQQRYCRGPSCAYPGISRYWQWIAQQLQQHAVLETPFGQKRHFFGRPGDDATIREAIAFMPQSTTARRTQLALWRIWKKMPHVRILAETYDSVTFEFPQHCDEHEVVEQALELMRVTLRRPDGSQYVVPGEAKTGWNWGNVTMQSDIDAALRRDGRPPRLNLDGLKKFNPKVGDSRQRQVGLQRQPLA